MVNQSPVAVDLVARLRPPAFNWPSTPVDPVD